MVEPGRNLDLAEETLRTQARRKLRVQDLQGHLAIMLEIVRQKHGGHTAPAHLALNAVSVGKRGLKSGAKVSH